jgi:hypothetical protein
MVKRIREANHTIVNSGMYRTRALCTRQKFSLYLQTSHGRRRTKSIRGTRQREDSDLWECFRCRGGGGGFRSTADFVRGSRTPSRAHVPVKSARKKKTRASLMPLASGSHASGSANEIACSAPRRSAPC